MQPALLKGSLSLVLMCLLTIVYFFPLYNVLELRSNEFHFTLGQGVVPESMSSLR